MVVALDRRKVLVGSLLVFSLRNLLSAWAPSFGTGIKNDPPFEVAPEQIKAISEVGRSCWRSILTRRRDGRRVNASEVDAYGHAEDYLGASKRIVTAPPRGRSSPTSALGRKRTPLSARTR